MPRPSAAEAPVRDARSRIAYPRRQQRRQQRQQRQQRLKARVSEAMRWIAQWMQSGRKIISISVAQVGTTAITSGLGFVFWWAAARLFTPTLVGFGAATTSTMLLLATLSVSGLGTTLIKELPRHPHHHGSLILSSGLIACLIGGCLGVTLAVAAPLFSATLRPLAANWETVLLFAAGVSITAVTILVDQSVIGLLREHLQVVRNAAFAAAKLAALIAMGVWLFGRAQVASLDLYSIYIAWFLGNAVSLVVLLLVALGRPAAALRHRPNWALLWSLGPAAFANHVLNMAFQASGLLLPAVVALLLPTTANAYFYTAWMLMLFVSTVPSALAVSLYAVSSADPGALAQRMRFTLSLSFLVTALANIVLLFGASPILAVFGPAYAAHGAWSLRIFGLGVFALMIQGHYVAIQRIGERVVRAVPLMSLGAVLEVGGAILGALLGGLQGLSVAWLIAVCIEAVLMGPPVYRAVRATSTRDPNVIVPTRRANPHG